MYARNASHRCGSIVVQIINIQPGIEISIYTHTVLVSYRKEKKKVAPRIVIIAVGERVTRFSN